MKADGIDDSIIEKPQTPKSPRPVANEEEMVHRYKPRHTYAGVFARPQAKMSAENAT